MPTSIANASSCLLKYTLLALTIMLDSPARSAERPNILFICTDDQASWAVGAAGNRQAITPHMDRLASQSAYLVNSFVSTPVCSPSRAATLTGRYGFEVGIHNWLKPDDQQNGLAVEITTFIDMLHDAGYHTGLVGKWHLGMNDRFYPTRQGFEYFMGHRHGGFKTVDPELEEGGREKSYSGLTADILADHVIGFLRDHQRQSPERPFLLCWHTRAPHTRWLPVASEDMQPYADAERKLEIPDYADLDRPRVQRMMREYLASVRSVDRNLGRVLGELDDLNLADQTVVVYTSDHGYNMGHHGIWHKGNGIWALTHDVPPTHNVARNYRPNMFDNSIRVPTFVRWPPVVEAGQVISHTTSNLDWFPTLLAIAGIDAPQELVLRGHNLLPLLRGESPQDWDEDFFGFYSSNYESQFVEEMRMIRTPRWKLVRYLRAPERDELFQLDDDPAEEHNRISDANELRTVIEQLDRKLKFHMQRCNDPALPLLPSPTRRR